MTEQLAMLEKQLAAFVTYECEVWSRVVGYYQMKSQWNPGKKAEDKMRKNYNIMEALK